VRCSSPPTTADRQILLWQRTSTTMW
jgi:hypothetical protein